MIPTSYLNFYNQLTGHSLSVSHILESYITYFKASDPKIAFICGAVLENGSFSILSEHSSTQHFQKYYSLQTHDIHLDIYNILPLQWENQISYNLFPFLTKSSYKELSTAIQSLCTSDGPILTMNVFFKNYLVCELILAFESKTILDKDLIAYYTFLRNNIESLLYPNYSTLEDSHTNLLFDTAELIISSKQYMNSDNRIFMSRLLDLCFESQGEADYGSALLFENGQWQYVHAIGHDFDALSKLSLPPEIYPLSTNQRFYYKELSPNIYLIEDSFKLFNIEDTPSYKNLFDNINKATKPIKQTIQLHIYYKGTLKGILSLDKKADTPTTFTRHSVVLLKKMNFIGQILFTYSSLNMNSQSLENLTHLISKLVTSPSATDNDFLHAFLALLVDSLYEADYAAAYIYDANGIYFLDAIGHDINALKGLSLKPHHFVNSDQGNKYTIPNTNNKYSKSNTIKASIISDIHIVAKENMPPEVYEQYMQASMPIKDGLISQAKLEDGVYMNISCDIKKDSQLSFSKDTIHLFTVLNNLGFAFISNQYYIDKYKTLNIELESKIRERTKALELSNQKLKAIVDKDSLTGLLNHKSILEKLETRLQSSTTTSIFLFDIDYFKLVNDTYGHQVGDEVLKKISQLILNDSSLISGRYGGEEFLVILPNMDLPDAIYFSQKLLNKIRNSSFIKDHTITVSGGVVTNKKGTATDMIRVADTLLYKAKDSGRDRIEYNYC